MRTTDAPDGRSKIYDTTRPETQAPIPETAEMRKKCFKLYVNWSAVAPGCTSSAKMSSPPTVDRLDDTTGPCKKQKRVVNHPLRHAARRGKSSVKQDRANLLEK